MDSAGPSGEGEIPLDTNAIERLLRGDAVARKSFLFVASPEGGRRAAEAYTLIKSAKINGAKPYAYLKDVLMRIRTDPQSRIDLLMPRLRKPLAEPSNSSCFANPGPSARPDLFHGHGVCRTAQGVRIHCPGRKGGDFMEPFDPSESTRRRRKITVKAGAAVHSLSDPNDGKRPPEPTLSIAGGVLTIGI